MAREHHVFALVRSACLSIPPGVNRVRIGHALDYLITNEVKYIEVIEDAGHVTKVT